jgi:hypothetical protein
MPYINTNSGKRMITRKQVLEGMRKFDEMVKKHGGRRTGTGWFVEEGGQRYPPKWVVSLATGVPRNEFGGGEGIHRPLKELGFKIGEVDVDDGPINEQVRPPSSLQSLSV